MCSPSITPATSEAALRRCSKVARSSGGSPRSGRRLTRRHGRAFPSRRSMTASSTAASPGPFGQVRAAFPDTNNEPARFPTANTSAGDSRTARSANSGSPYRHNCRARDNDDVTTVMLMSANDREAVRLSVGTAHHRPSRRMSTRTITIVITTASTAAPASAWPTNGSCA
jgi:hypothetical protein